MSKKTAPKPAAPAKAAPAIGPAAKAVGAKRAQMDAGKAAKPGKAKC
jgi:hypothetical protein